MSGLGSLSFSFGSWMSECWPSPGGAAKRSEALGRPGAPLHGTDAPHMQHTHSTEGRGLKAGPTAKDLESDAGAKRLNLPAPSGLAGPPLCFLLLPKLLPSTTEARRPWIAKGLGI